MTVILIAVGCAILITIGLLMITWKINKFYENKEYKCPKCGLKMEKLISGFWSGSDRGGELKRGKCNKCNSLFECAGEGWKEESK